MLADSKDKVIKSLNPTLKIGKKRKVRDTIRSAKVSLAFKEIIEHIQTGRQGLGINESSSGQKLSTKITRI